VALVSYTFEVLGTPTAGSTPVAPIINLFRRDAPLGGYNLDGVTQSMGEPPGPPLPEYSLRLSLTPTQREPGQASGLRIEVLLNNERALDNFLIQLVSSNQTVAPLPTSVMTDASGMVLMEVIAMGVGATTITATMTVGDGTYASNPVSMIVINEEARENYDMTGYGTVVISLESSLSRGIYPRPQRLSNEEQRNKYPDDTGLTRVAYYANMDFVFLPTFLQK
jgi:hypothetical protein